jgi:hypothetical protein
VVAPPRPRDEFVRARRSDDNPRGEEGQRRYRQDHVSTLWYVASLHNIRFPFASVCGWMVPGTLRERSVLGPRRYLIEVGVLRAYQPRAATAMPSKICPIDSWNDPGVGSRKMVTGIEMINNTDAQRG